MISCHVGMNTGLDYRRAQIQRHLEGPSRMAVTQRFLESNNIMIGIEKGIALRCHIQYDLYSTQKGIL